MEKSAPRVTIDLIKKGNLTKKVIFERNTIHGKGLQFFDSFDGRKRAKRHDLTQISDSFY